MKVYIDKFRELWKIKRYRSILLLLLYVLFFMFVSSYISTNKTTFSIQEPTEVTGLDYFKNITNYKYSINGLHNFDVIVNENITINYQNNSYTKYNIPEELNIYDLNIYNPNTIYKVINNATLAATNYIDKTSTYIINNIKFNKLLYNQDVTLDYTIKIITYNESVDKVEIYFNDYTLLLEEM